MLVSVVCVCVCVWQELPSSSAGAASGADDVSTMTSGVSTVDSASQPSQHLDTTKCRQLQAQVKEIQLDNNR